MLFMFKRQNISVTSYNSKLGMKEPIHCLILLLTVTLTLADCPVPPNCDTYSASQQKCLSCLPNYLLVNNACIATLTLTTLIAQQTAPATVTVPLQNTQFQTVNTAPPQPSNVFVPWYISPAPLQPQPPTQSQYTYGYTYSYAQPSPNPPNAPSFTSYSSSPSFPFVASAGSYNDSNCKVKDSTNSSCLECYPSYFFNTSEAKCCVANPLCKEFIGQSQCTQCYAGYSLVNGTCILDPSFGIAQTTPTPTNAQGIVNRDGNCKTYANSLCSECYASYYYNSTLNRCVPFNQNCKTVTQNNICTTCYSGYQLNAQTGNCDPLAATATASSAAATSVMQSAAQSATQSAAQSATQSAAQSATSASNQAGSQFITLNGYIYQINPQSQVIGPLTSSGSAPLQGNPNQNAAANQGVSQQKCFYREVLVGGECVKVSNQCKNWSNSTAACTECYQGYQLASGACLLQ